MKAATTGLSVAFGCLHAGFGVSLLVPPEGFRSSALAPQLRDHRLPVPDFKLQSLLKALSMDPSAPASGGSSGHADGGSRPSDDPSGPGAQVLSDIVGAQRSINIFAGLLRDVDPVYARISSSGSTSTLLAPTNAAMTALAHKPWEQPGDYSTLGADAYSGPQGEERAYTNLRRFVERHIVAQSPWREGEKTTTLDGESESGESGESGEGKQIWWETKEGRKVIQPGDIAVTAEKTTSNGEIWIIERALVS